MVAPVAHSGIAHVLRQCVDLRHLRHRSMERGVEAGDLRQARECLGERPRAAHVEGLMRGFHRRQRFEVVQHVALDPHRRLEARTAEHHAVAGRHHLHVGDVGFQPGDDEVQRCLVVDCLAVAPFMRVPWLAGRVLRDEMRVVLHAVDLAAAEQRQRPGRVHRIGAELQAGGARIDHDDGIAHGRSLRGFGQQDGGIARQRVGVQHGGSGREEARGGGVSTAGQDHRHPRTDH